MVSAGNRNAKIRLVKILEDTGLSSEPNSNTLVFPHNPQPNNIPTIVLPMGIGLLGASNVNFCVELGTGVINVDIQEWYLYETDDGPKWFAGEVEKKIEKSSAYIVFEANAIGFFAQIVKFTGSGTVKIYASGDYID